MSDAIATAEEHKKLKVLAACSRDIIIVMLEKDVLLNMIPRKFAFLFIDYRDALLRGINEDSSEITAKIDSNNFNTSLSQAGLSGEVLDFKYSFFSTILKLAGLPSLDDYGDDDIAVKTYGPTVSVLRRIKQTFLRNIKKVRFRKWIDVIFDTIDNILDSIGSAIPGVGEATKEIKHCLEIGKKINDTVQKKPRIE
jgi:hypothetical protein